MRRIQNRLAWVLLLFGLCAEMLSWSALAAQDGEKIYEDRCGMCHELPDPDKPPPEGKGHWKERLDLMAPNAGLSGKEKAAVLEFLQNHEKGASSMVSFAQEQQVFEKKCSLCHTIDRVFRIPLTDESRAHIVKRMQERAQDWITNDEAHEILEYLGKVGNKAPGEIPRAGPASENEAGDGPAALFRHRCSACHTLERVYLKLEEDPATAWMHIVSRMQKKSPDWLTSKEAQKIAEYLKTLKPVGGVNE
ncbi:quinohemoprotein amine dehydrogenase alpha subunit-like protein [Thiogranum longum]|uniref:Quinohemoprotein amine dehydrogenase alpha subunit-like protein n=1 Tax=Thiogranum longum TaxID=1537524 RepID=A0A4R1H607_9GAMM|nr:c-type cytochrome [Thiogranum longum]TCK17167.1 quinohemoprotein amine dehydrogenase alpha subunit-like protein [Thiogranum longum]